MKNIFKNTVILQAISLGFDFSQFSTDTEIQEIEQALTDFFNDTSDKLEVIEDECEVTNNGRTQHVRYGDYWCDGEIVSFSDHWHKSPETKVYHSDFIIEDEGIIKQMQLYYLVGETDYNTPGGYYYDKSTGRHEKFEINQD